MAAKTQDRGKGSDATSELRPTAELIRRQLRTALYKARRAAGMTQKATAGELDWSLSKVVRIEQGVGSISPSDVRLLLSVFGVADKKRIDHLVELARQARDAPSWENFGSVMSDSFRDLVAQEGSARQIWKHEPTFVPGLLQTEGYTRAALAALGRHGKDLEDRANLRAKRQLLLEQEVQPELHFVLGEAVLRRPVGGTATMRELIRHLVALNARPNVNLHLLPLAAGAHPVMGTPFTILQFDIPDLDDVLYLEDGQSRTSESDDPEKIKAFISHYNVVQEMADKYGSFDEQALQLLADLFAD